jgi:chromosome segregation ATPase
MNHAACMQGGNVKKLKMMALKFKKENETLKASLVSAQKSLQTANARTAELEGASQTSPGLQEALDAAEAAVQEAKAESQKTKKMALALKKKNSQLTEQLAEQTKQVGAVGCATSLCPHTTGLPRRKPDDTPL